MNILYINHYAGSPNHGMEYRTYYFAKSWQNKGHKVNIISSSYSHLRKKQPKRVKYSILYWIEEIDGISYTWYRTPKYYKNGIKRFINILTFLILVLFDSPRIIKNLKPDVVIASSTYPLDIWLARYISIKGKAKLIFELHDIWPLSPIQINGMSPNNPFIKLCSFAEKIAYTKSDLIVSMLPCIDKYISLKNFKVKNLTIIPNGYYTKNYNLELLKLPSNLDNFLTTCKRQNKFIVIYCGSHGIPNSLDNLINAANLLRNDKNICFCLVGEGLEKKKLSLSIKQNNLMNVMMFKSIPLKSVNLLLSKCDIGYIGAPKCSLYKYGISPNKLLDYMYAQLPIICSIEAGNDIVSDANCGSSISSENPEKLSQEILRFKSMEEKELKKLGLNGKRYIEKNYSYEKLSQKFLESIYDLYKK